MVQCVLPCLVFSGGSVTITGGTNVSMSPQLEYLTLVFAPIASRMGVAFELKVSKRVSGEGRNGGMGGGKLDVVCSFTTRT